MGERAIALQANEKDNVATIFAEGIVDGTQVSVLNASGNKAPITVMGDVPYGHKIALRDIAKGEQILKYGEEIGVATHDIKLGEYVHVHNLDSMRGRGDLEQAEGGADAANVRQEELTAHAGAGTGDDAPGSVGDASRSASAGGSLPSKPVSHAQRIGFWGYERPDGRYGARNLVAIIPSVTCANDVAQAISRQVQGTVAYLHHQGCCQLPPDLERVTDTLIGLGKGPNVAAVLIVSLGCEGTDHARMYEELHATGKSVEIIHIQELGGVTNAIREGTDIARRLVLGVSGQRRVETDISNVVMSIKCGASDTTSGVASNCVIGVVSDRLVDLGATVVFGETTEFIGGEHLLARRAVSERVGQRIYDIVDEMEARAKSIGCDMRRGQPTPGNIAGGLSSIEEKSLGAIAKSGSRPIQGVLDYPEFVTNQKGLWIKDTPGREPEILTGMAATGAQFMCFSTGLGAPQGFPSMPVIKICGNPHTYQRMREDMDVNAGLVVTGEKSIEEVADEVFAKIIRVLNGEMTKNEAIGYFSAIDIHCLGPVI